MEVKNKKMSNAGSYHSALPGVSRKTGCSPILARAARIDFNKKTVL